MNSERGDPEVLSLKKVRGNKAPTGLKGTMGLFCQTKPTIVAVNDFGGRWQTERDTTYRGRCGKANIQVLKKVTFMVPRTAKRKESEVFGGRGRKSERGKGPGSR